MDTTWKDSMDMNQRVYNDTGKYPALKGFDFIDAEVTSYSGCGNGSEQAYEALAWWKGRSGAGTVTAANYSSFGSQVSTKHGIIAFNWHWRVPVSASATTDPSPDSDQFYTPAGNSTSNTAFTIPMNSDGTLNTASASFSILKDDMDLVAAQLSILQDAGVPVLWRPLHEASGGWFWWGATRTDGVTAATAYKALYRYMYDYFTNTKGLHNLSWVWNGQDASWYPGADVVDITGWDVYGTAKDYQSDISYFNTLKSIDASKLIALTETGTIPSPSKLIADGAAWSWFMAWNDGNSSDGAEGVTDSGNFWTGEYYNAAAHKTEVYSADYVITLDELPDLTAYAY
jgi:mannan endo-1,4-beta-mannosidase